VSDRLWLLVDDDPDLAFIARLLLRRRGDTLLHASYVAEAERMLAAESRPLIVLLDVHLPDLSGTDWLRQRPPQRPVAMFVQSQMNDDLASALELGATYWMPKEYVTQQEKWNERLDEIIQLEAGTIQYKLVESEPSLTISSWWDLTRRVLAQTRGA
jgi:CheY-like chemotaxis protein